MRSKRKAVVKSFRNCIQQTTICFVVRLIGCVNVYFCELNDDIIVHNHS